MIMKHTGFGILPAPQFAPRTRQETHDRQMNRIGRHTIIAG
jgi:hypothetical protein